MSALEQSRDALKTVPGVFVSLDAPWIQPPPQLPHRNLNSWESNINKGICLSVAYLVLNESVPTKNHNLGWRAMYGDHSGRSDPREENVGLRSHPS